MSIWLDPSLMVFHIFLVENIWGLQRQSMMNLDIQLLTESTSHLKQRSTIVISINWRDLKLIKCFYLWFSRFVVSYCCWICRPLNKRWILLDGMNSFGFNSILSASLLFFSCVILVSSVMVAYTHLMCCPHYLRMKEMTTSFFNHWNFFCSNHRYWRR